MFRYRLWLAVATGLALTVGYESRIAAEPPKTAAAAERKEPVRLDLYGDPLPEGAIARLGTVRWRHLSGVACVAFSPDGKMLASGARDGSIAVWDVRTGKSIRHFRGKTYPVVALAFSPDAKALAAGSFEGTVRSWELATGRELFSFAHPGEFPFDCLRLAYSPDGRKLASTGVRSRQLPGAKADWDEDRRVFDTLIFLQEAATGKLLRQLECPQSYCTSIAFSPDSKVLAAGRLNAYSGKDGKSRRAFLLWEVDTGKELRGLAGEELQVRSVAFSPDGKILASGNDDKTVQFWEVSSGRELRRLNAGGRSGLSPDVLRQLGRGVFIVFSADGKTLVSACDDRTVLLWDVNTGKEVRELPAEFHPDCMALSRHGLLTGAGGTAIRLLDVATGKAPPRPEGHLGTVSSLGFSPDGKMIASASSDIRLWEAATGREIRRLPGRATVAFSPDGSKLVCGGADYTLRLHETATGRELRRFPASRQGLTHPTAVAFSPDGKLLASESSRIVGLWEVDTGKEVPVIGRDELNKAFNYLRPQVDSLAYSPDGKTIAWASAHKELCLFQVAPQKSYRKFDQMAVKSVAFSPDGKLLAAAAGRNVRHTRDFGISLWEVGTGREYRRFAEKLPELRAVAFSPDGKSVASGSRDGVLRLWEVTTARERHHFLGHCGPIYSIGFSRDGKSVASGSEDTTILVWDLRSEGDRGENTQLTTEQFEGHWSALAGDDAAKAYQAILKLAAAPGTSVPFLRKHLKPAVALDAKRIAQLVADLDDNQFAVREKAATGVRQLGEAAAPALRKALERKPSLELRRRAEAILDAIDKQILPPERLRVLRAIEVLEHIGTDGAKAVLKELAKGAPEDRLTEEAKLSLGRLERRAREHR